MLKRHESNVARLLLGRGGGGVSGLRRAETERLAFVDWLQCCVAGRCTRTNARRNAGEIGKGFGATPKDMNERSNCPGNAWRDTCRRKKMKRKNIKGKMERWERMSTVLTSATEENAAVKAQTDLVQYPSCAWTAQCLTNKSTAVFWGVWDNVFPRDWKHYNIFVIGGVRFKIITMR